MAAAAGSGEHAGRGQPHMPHTGAGVKVYVRLRPVLDEAAGVPCLAGDPEEPTVLVSRVRWHRQALRSSGRRTLDALPQSPKADSPKQEHTYDRVFRQGAGQVEVFNEVMLRMIDHVLQGFNACCFAYGQTGSGKTFTMFGERGESRGIIPRAVEHVFSALEDVSHRKEVAVVVSFLEIYCDRVRDLGSAYLEEGRGTVAAREKTSDWFLAGNRRASFAATERSKRASVYASENLHIHEDVGGNVFVKDLSVIPVGTPEEVMAIVQTGFRLRATHETKMNTVSSRSHTVFTMHVLQKDKGTGETVTGMLNMVDLAGSERLGRSASQGQRLTEAQAINSSLSALGKVVMALHAGGVGMHVPYRDSKLTRLLQNSLGGNSITAVLATVHPRHSDFDESVTTLQFATRCLSVANRPTQNFVLTSGAAKDKRIAALTAENAQLRKQVGLLRVAGDMRVVRALLEVGVQGALLPNGQFQTLDGALLGLTTAAAEASEYAQRQVGDWAASGERGAPITAADMFGAAAAGAVGAQGGHRAVPAGMQLARAAKADALATVKARVRELKVELTQVREAGRLEAAQLRTQLREQRSKAAQATAAAEAARRSVETKVAAARAAATATVRTVMGEGQELMETQLMRATARPDALLAAAASPPPAARNVEAELEARVAHQVAALKFSAAAEMETLQHRMRETAAASQAAQAAAQQAATEASTAADKRCGALEAELAQLLDYSAGMCDIVRGMQEGRFPVQLSALLESLGVARPRLLGGQGKPLSAALLAEAAAPSGSVPASPQATTAVDVEADPQNMDLEACRAFAAALQAHIAGGLRAQLEEQVLADVQTHPTVQYIQTLEEQVRTYQVQVREEATRAKGLRVALEAQRRVAAKSATLPALSVRRPGTADSFLGGASTRGNGRSKRRPLASRGDVTSASGRYRKRGGLLVSAALAVQLPPPQRRSQSPRAAASSKATSSPTVAFL